MKKMQEDQAVDEDGSMIYRGSYDGWNKTNQLEWSNEGFKLVSSYEIGV